MEFKVNNQQDLFDLIINCMNNENITGSLVLSDDMQFNIKLKGKKWDGQIDQNTVSILNSFYNSLFEALKQSNNNLPKDIKNKIRVIATIDEGCENIIIALKDLISYIKDMNAKQIMAVSSIILILASGYTAKQVIDTVREKNKQQFELKKREMELDNMLEMYKSSSVIPMDIAQKPYIQAKNKMDKEDILTIVSTNKEYSKQELGEEFTPVDIEADIQTYYVDSEYYVTERKNIKTNSATIKEKITGKIIKEALVLLNDTEKAVLAEHLDKKTIVKLQVTIDVDNNGNIISSNIVGIGEARENTTNISEIFK